MSLVNLGLPSSQIVLTDLYRKTPTRLSTIEEPEYLRVHRGVIRLGNGKWKVPG